MVNALTRRRLNDVLFNDIRLPPSQIGMIVDKGPDFPAPIEASLMKYGQEMWTFRKQPDHATTRVLNSYKGENRR